MVCVGFLRTQQCAKSQCLLVLDRMAWCVLSCGGVSGCRVLDSFGKYDSCRDLSVQGLAAVSLGWSSLCLNGEFDPGSGRTLAACLTHASRAERPFGVLERRTGE